MTVRSFEHIGLIVRDLEATASFFELLGFDVGQVAEVGGEWADRVNGLSGTRLEMVFVTAPDGTGAIELSRFLSPANTDAPADMPSDALGCVTSPTGWTISSHFWSECAAPGTT